MTDQEWNLFVDNGVVDIKIIYEIAYKIYNASKMTEKEIAIYKHCGKDIEVVLTKLKMIENVRKRQ
jgi:hypothetical protein